MIISKSKMEKGDVNQFLSRNSSKNPCGSALTSLVQVVGKPRGLLLPTQLELL